MIKYTMRNCLWRKQSEYKYPRKRKTAVYEIRFVTSTESGEDDKTIHLYSANKDETYLLNA